jgi:hypothetical protein
MSTTSTSPKKAYVYDSETDTWFPIAGLSNTAANYSWTGTHDFHSVVTFQDVLTSTAGINNFLNPSARDLAIPSPTHGIVCFIKQDNSGNVVNQIQYYSTAATSWITYTDTQYATYTANHVLALQDSGRTLNANSSSAITFTVPPNSSVAFPIGTRIDAFQYGTGQLAFVEGAGVTIRSKNSNKKISAQYSAAGLYKVETDVWLLIGDLTA